MSKILKTKRVLAIDDDRDILQLITATLRNMGIGSVFSESNAKAAWRHYLGDNNVPLDLVICDWMMPGMDGLELLEKVREHDSKVPFVMLTAISKSGSVQAALACGASGYILKPFAIGALQNKALSILI